jgi:hypothetical protein
LDRVVEYLALSGVDLHREKKALVHRARNKVENQPGVVRVKLDCAHRGLGAPRRGNHRRSKRFALAQKLPIVHRETANFLG